MQCIGKLIVSGWVAVLSLGVAQVQGVLTTIPITNFVNPGFTESPPHPFSGAAGAAPIYGWTQTTPNPSGTNIGFWLSDGIALSSRGPANPHSGMRFVTAERDEGGPSATSSPGSATLSQTISIHDDLAYFDQVNADVTLNLTFAYSSRTALPDAGVVSVDFLDSLNGTIHSATTNTMAGTPDGTWVTSSLGSNVIVPIGTESFRINLSFTRKSGGTHTYMHFDTFEASFTGVAVPEPSAFLFGGLICGVLAVSTAIKSRRAKAAA